MQRWIGWSAVAVVAVATLIWQLTQEPVDSYAFKEGPDFPRRGYAFDTSHLAIRSQDGSQTFEVPRPSDPQWNDYLKMKKHRQYQSFMDGRAGYAIPYDPEWRALVRGYRDAARVDYDLIDTALDLESLATQVLRAIREKDSQLLREMHVRMEEFETVCWPSFPQSRPYVRIPVQEAWGFHFAACTAGVTDLLRQHGGRDLVLDRVEVGERVTYPPNFALLNAVKIVAHDRASSHLVTITGVKSVIERNGRYKVFIYQD